MNSFYESSGFYQARFKNPEVITTETGFFNTASHALIVEHFIQLMARLAGLRDLNLGRPYLKNIADIHICFRHARQTQVLTKRTWNNFTLQYFIPILEMFNTVGTYGLIRSAMNSGVANTIPYKPEMIQKYRLRNGELKNS